MSTEKEQIKAASQKIHEDVQQNKAEEEKQPGAKKQNGFLRTVKPLQAFFTKFNNDWVMNFASGLSFNILTAIFPIAIAIIAIAGFVVGSMLPGARQQLIDGLTTVFPSSLSSNGHSILEPALLSLSKNAGLLGIVSIIMALFGGSRLFITLEGYFDIIYHTKPRTVIHQNVMAFFMMLVFLILMPAMIFAGSGPAFVMSLLNETPLASIPNISILFGFGSLLFGVLSAWIFFLSIYIVVPHRKISFRRSWLGALVAAVLLQLYLTLFPLYVTHFLNNYTGSAGAVGFAVILLFFLYYFAVILLLGAEINAFVVEKIRSTPYDVPTMIHDLTTYMEEHQKEAEKKAAPQEVAATTQMSAPVDFSEAIAFAGQAELERSKAEKEAEPRSKKSSRSEKSSSSPKKSATPQKILTVAEVVAGTTVAFLIEFFRLRRKAPR